MIPVIPLESEQLLTYPFGWIDHVIEVVLRTGSAGSGLTAGDEWSTLHADLPAEVRQIWNTLKQQRFRMLFKKRQEIVVNYYYEYLVKAREQVSLQMTWYKDIDPQVILGHAVLEQLEELLQQLKSWYGPVLPEGTKKESKHEDMIPSFKVLCRLSVDQIAIVLKAADEIRLLTSRSFSLVLRTLVPFLSTERLRDFSWKSARSSTYKMEDGDKEVAIRALEALIEKIREY